MSTGQVSENPRAAAAVNAAHMRRNLLPRLHAPLRAFMVAVAIMVFLAELAVAAVMMTRLAVEEWTAGVVSEATAQVLPRPDEHPHALRNRAEKAAELLRGVKGVRSVEVLGNDASRALLEPWLGQAAYSSDLPVPIIIAIRLDRKNPPGVEALRAALKGTAGGAKDAAAGAQDAKDAKDASAGDVKDVVVDAHGRWVRVLSDLATTAEWVGVGVVVIIAVALVLLVVHAARAAVEGNRETIELLHLIGARDRFVARQVERHFIRTGFRAALTGAAAAWLALVLLGLLAPAGGIGSTIMLLLFSTGQETAQLYMLWLWVVLVAVFISLVTARISAMRILNDMFKGQ